MSLDKVLHDKSLELEMTRKWAGEKISRLGGERGRRGSSGERHTQKKDTRGREGGGRVRARSLRERKNIKRFHRVCRSWRERKNIRRFHHVCSAVGGGEEEGGRESHHCLSSSGSGD
jgi:hypothetical protein